MHRKSGTQLLIGIAALCLISAQAAFAQKPVKGELSYDGQTRRYLVYLPQPVAGEQLPLVVLLHGSGRDGSSLLEPWLGLARKEHIALVAPDSLVRTSWHTALDGVDFLKLVVEAVIGRGGIDPRRVYLFGHSAGGHHALMMGLLESEYFAAVTVHAGALVFDPEFFIDQADRKIPIGIWSGTDDRIVPIGAVRETVARLKSQGFPVMLNEMPRHTHDYYGSSDEVNAAAWKMLKGERLAADPKFKPFKFTK